jgi:hypothetical protein
MGWDQDHREECREAIDINIVQLISFLFVCISNSWKDKDGRGRGG